jgi:predicted metal-dependent hydrolase
MPVPAATRPYHHVRANRFAELAGQQVGYELKRSRRRTIGFLVGPDGLTVAAPRWVSLTDVTQGLREKEGWILRKLQEQRERGERAAAAKVDWRDGASLPFMGRRIEIALDPARAGALLDATTGQLRVGLPGHASPEQIRDAVQAWLMRQASRVFTERLDHFAPLLGVRWQRLRLSSAATRWGSASADGAIRLNWRLIHYSEALIDYVVAHELSHLRVMDHSPAFWETVASVMPDYSTRREQLKDEHLPVL